MNLGPEDSLQSACVQWFRLQYPKKIIFAIPNGGKRHPTAGKKLKLTGVLAGVLDLFIPHAVTGWHGFFIEMKAPGRIKDTSDEQKVMIQRFRDEGYFVEVIDNFDDFQDAVKSYFSS